MQSPGAHATITKGRRAAWVAALCLAPETVPSFVAAKARSPCTRCMTAPLQRPLLLSVSTFHVTSRMVRNAQISRPGKKRTAEYCISLIFDQILVERSNHLFSTLLGVNKATAVSSYFFQHPSCCFWLALFGLPLSVGPSRWLRFQRSMRHKTTTESGTYEVQLMWQLLPFCFV